MMDGGGASPDSEVAGTRRRLAQSDCAALLRSAEWGVVAVAEIALDGAVPVAVPTAYAFDGVRLYLAMSDGRKLRALERNPNLCLNVADVRSVDDWRSVTVIGHARWITADADREAAVSAFLRQSLRSDGGVDPATARRLSVGRFLAVEVEELHGFASGDSSARATSGSRDVGLSLVRDVPEPDDAAVDAMSSLRQLVRALRAADSESEASLGVTAAQLFVLRAIRSAGSLSVSELAHRTATAQSSVSEVVTRLARKGVIVRRRSAADRRRTEIALSDAGRALLERVPETVQERLVAAFRRWPVERQRATARLLRTWIDDAGLGGVDAAMFFEPSTS
jgi:DNA-binding MarR family transcriptional regulator/nitroimidazol reductase NimA-like FMN-containing flavoprotein (pyridoxamine 5'-phosphate oxidase superfamily)